VAKVFITWSGVRSRWIANALREFLPTVIQSIEVFVSTSGIAKGTTWQSIIFKNLEEADIGIICLTPENLFKGWLHFEAGALSKKMVSGQSRVCTYLYDLKATDIRYPLSMFQHTLAKREDTRKLLLDIKQFSKASLTDEALNKTFEKMWPDFEAALRNTPLVTVRKRRKAEDMIDEVLTLTREIAKSVTAQRAATSKLTVSPAERTLDELARYLINKGWLTALPIDAKDRSDVITKAVGAMQRADAALKDREKSEDQIINAAISK